MGAAATAAATGSGGAQAQAGSSRVVAPVTGPAAFGSGLPLRAPIQRRRGSRASQMAAGMSASTTAALAK